LFNWANITLLHLLEKQTQQAVIMRFTSTFLSALSLSSAAFSAPIVKRALTAQSYNDFSVSAGVAGEALAEVNAKFPVSTAFRADKIILNLLLDRLE
jgi:hypothetical protein